MPVLGKSALALLAILALHFLLTPIHEGAHYLVAKATGLPVVSVEWFGGRVEYGDTGTVGWTLSNYAGGLVAGFLLLAILFSSRTFFHRQRIFL